MDLIENKKYQTTLIGVLVVLAYVLAYYFQNILKTGEIYTHFFYIPIILSCIWWKRKGLYITAALLGIIILGQNLIFENRLGVEDGIRASMLLIISLITVGLSEALSGVRQQLRVSETQYRTIFENTGTAMAIIEPDTIMSLVNSEFERLSGYTKAEIENKMSWKDFVAKEHLIVMSTYHEIRRTSLNNAPKKYEFKFITRSNEIRYIFITIDMIPGTPKSVGSFSDITDLKQTLKKQKALQAELSTALAKVLSGFIPICANCKKIRDEQNNWIQLESFLSEKTAADFSHGICPQCAKELYSEFFIDLAETTEVNKSA